MSETVVIILLLKNSKKIHEKAFRNENGQKRKRNRFVNWVKYIRLDLLVFHVPFNVSSQYLLTIRLYFQCKRLSKHYTASYKIYVCRTYTTVSHIWKLTLSYLSTLSFNVVGYTTAFT